MTFDVGENVLERVAELLRVLHGEAERRDEEDDVLVVALHGRDDLLLAHSANERFNYLHFWTGYFFRLSGIDSAVFESLNND